MNTVIKARIVKIGNSQGIRIPKVWLDQVKLGEDVEVAVQPDQLVIRPARRPRHDWDKRLCAMAEHGDDRLLDEAIPTQWDKDEWEW